MSTSIDDVRRFLIAHGLSRTAAALDLEFAADLSSPRLPSEQADPHARNSNLNLSFGENDSSHHIDGGHGADPQASMRNNVDAPLDHTSHSQNVSSNSNRRLDDKRAFAKSENLPDTVKKSNLDQEGSNPFDVGEDEIPVDKKKLAVLGADEDKFSFGAEGEGDELPENNFDSFSKSHNNKYSKNDEGEEANVFGNSFDLNLEGAATRPAKGKKGALASGKGVNLFGPDDIERAKSEVNNVVDDAHQPKKTKMELHKSEVKSIDNDVVWGSDMRAAAQKRASQGFNVFANTRGLAKQLFPGMDSEDIFMPGQGRGAIPMRKSDGGMTRGSHPGTIRPEFADTGELTSDRALLRLHVRDPHADRPPEGTAAVLLPGPGGLLPDDF